MDAAYLWIRDCINSCRDGWQLNCCLKLLELFKEKYKEEGKALGGQLLHTIITKQTIISVEA